MTIKNNMVAAFIWGPMQWRMMHGLAFLYDMQPNENPKVFHEYMKTMAGILPCKECRSDCTAEFERNGHIYEDLIRTNGAQFAVFQLHNFVNAKLHRAVIAVKDFHMVQHRSRLWGNEFTAYGMFGFLFLIALNFCKAIEEDNAYEKINAAYHAYLLALGALLRFINMDALADSIIKCNGFVSGIDVSVSGKKMVCNANNVSVNLFYILHAEYAKHGFTEDNMTIMNRFSSDEKNFK